MYTIKNNVYRNILQVPDIAFEQQYIAVRQKEGRVYTDAEVGKLPEIAANHPLHNEWAIRKESAKRLVAYCKNNSIQSVLEVGCGNGWLCNMLSSIQDIEVVGVDVNLQELEQAARVFKKQHLYFIYDAPDAPSFLSHKFDMIIFAASVQYFPSLHSVIDLAMQKLSPKGALHILDSFFYKPSEIAAAAERTKMYYTSLGFPGMADAYFHHCINDLEQFQPRIQYQPGTFINKMKGYSNPFPWVVIPGN